MFHLNFNQYKNFTNILGWQHPRHFKGAKRFETHSSYIDTSPDIRCIL